ncbi:hypothetical protein D3C80_1472160 [compost metagenome]
MIALKRIAAPQCCQCFLILLRHSLRKSTRFTHAHMHMPLQRNIQTMINFGQDRRHLPRLVPYEHHNIRGRSPITEGCPCALRLQKFITNIIDRKIKQLAIPPKPLIQLCIA